MFGGSCRRHPVCLSLGPPPHAWSGRYVGQGTVNKQFALTEVADNRAAIHRASHKPSASSANDLDFQSRALPSAREWRTWVWGGGGALIVMVFLDFSR